MTDEQGWRTVVFLPPAIPNQPDDDERAALEHATLRRTA